MLKDGVTLTLNYRKVLPNESEEVFLLLKSAAEWLRERGINYWQDWHNPPQNFKDWIMEGIINGEFYFAEDETDIAGMFRVQYSDEMFWGKRTDSAAYLHSFTTVRKNYGRGIGTTMLKDIERLMAEKGIAYLRLDCSADVARLCKYYENAGFMAVGEIKLFDDTMTLYEKKVVG